MGLEWSAVETGGFGVTSGGGRKGILFLGSQEVGERGRENTYRCFSFYLLLFLIKLSIFDVGLT